MKSVEILFAEAMEKLRQAGLADKASRAISDNKRKNGGKLPAIEVQLQIAEAILTDAKDGKFGKPVQESARQGKSLQEIRESMPPTRKNNGRGVVMTETDAFAVRQKAANRILLRQVGVSEAQITKAEADNSIPDE